MSNAKKRTIELAEDWYECSIHAGMRILFNKREWKKCPHCTMLEMLNPTINEMREQKPMHRVHVKAIE